jgi:hypothetical protein
VKSDLHVDDSKSHVGGSRTYMLMTQNHTSVVVGVTCEIQKLYETVKYDMHEFGKHIATRFCSGHFSAAREF